MNTFEYKTETVDGVKIITMTEDGLKSLISSAILDFSSNFTILLEESAGKTGMTMPPRAKESLFRQLGQAVQVLKRVRELPDLDENADRTWWNVFKGLPTSSIEELEIETMTKRLGIKWTMKDQIFKVQKSVSSSDNKTWILVYNEDKSINYEHELTSEDEDLGLLMRKVDKRYVVARYGSYEKGGVQAPVLQIKDVISAPVSW